MTCLHCQYHDSCAAKGRGDDEYDGAELSCGSFTMSSQQPNFELASNDQAEESQLTYDEFVAGNKGKIAV